MIGSETLVVGCGGFEMEDPWLAPASCTPVRLRRATDGAAPRLATTVAAWFDELHLSILFSAADDHVEATMLGHDQPLYEQDVFEVFFAPEDLTRYFELEVSPRGTIFDARVVSPDGDRATMHVDRAWDCEGLVATVRVVTESDGSKSVDTLLRIPFSSVGRSTPRDGERWRANFFRVDRHPAHGDEFSAWQPAMKFPPDFHVPAVFGTLLFGSFPGNSTELF